MATELGDFALVDEDGGAAPANARRWLSSPPETRRMRSSSTVDGRALGRSVAPPLTYSELLSMCDADGKFSDVTQLRVRQCAFYVGVVRDDDVEPSGDDEDDPSLTFEARRALWRFLLRGTTPALSRGETQKLAVDYRARQVAVGVDCVVSGAGGPLCRLSRPPAARRQGRGAHRPHAGILPRRDRRRRRTQRQRREAAPHFDVVLVLQL
jgi:hypothetical protein